MGPRNFFLAMLPDRVVVRLATLGPVGMRMPAPGTFGSLAGLLGGLLYLPFLHPLLALLVTAVLIAAAVPICGEAETRLHKRDPSEIVLDEAVAMPLVFVGVFPLPAGEPGLAVLITGFALFRFFDILKPLGISRLQRIPGGRGVVYDDLAAAVAAALVLQVAIQVEVLP